MKKHEVITVCYGQEQRWGSREEAQEFFLEAMLNSDGAERDRYTNVYCKLLNGQDHCTDIEE